MCDHDDEGKNFIVLRLILTLLLFILGYMFKPLLFWAYLIIGTDVLIKACKNIINGHMFDESFLMALATLGAICIKEYPEAVMVMFLYQLGEFLQDRAIEKSKKSISALMNIRSDYANLNGQKVSPEKIKIGDVITVKTGEKIPLDGIIETGNANIDTSALTGETLPKHVEVGNEVLSGCINLDGLLDIKVTKTFGNSTVSRILELVENAASKKAKTEKFITKFAKYYTPIVVVIALAIACIPPFYIERALTFLVISCPCALVISIPLSFFAGIGGASANGILIKGSSYLEALARTKTVLFDKTGTLTKGNFKVVEINSENADLLKYAAMAESASSHPIAIAIRDAYAKENINSFDAKIDIKEIAGCGTQAKFDGITVLVGNAKFVNVKPIEKSGTVVYVSINGKYEGYIVIADEIKTDSKAAIDELKKSKIVTGMLTGDSKGTAERVADALGIDKVFAQLLPKDKVNKVEETILKKNGSVVFVGDGINDAPVLTRADVGIAMGGLGSDAAIEAADVVIMDDKPSKVIAAIKIAKKTMLIAKENIIFALGIKVLFLILGGFGLVTMWGAVFADVGVSIIAILNALRAAYYKN